jgi:hypothetical protein
VCDEHIQGAYRTAYRLFEQALDLTLTLLSPMPVECQMHRRTSRIPKRVICLLETVRLTQPHDQFLQQIVGDVLAEGQPHEQGVQLPPSRVKEALKSGRWVTQGLSRCKVRFDTNYKDDSGSLAQPIS